MALLLLPLTGALIGFGVPTWYRRQPEPVDLDDWVSCRVARVCLAEAKPPSEGLELVETPGRRFAC